MTLSSYVLFCLAFAAAVAVPGPGVAALVGRALKSGFTATLPMLLGIIIGDLTWFAFASLGLAMLAATLGGVFSVIKLVGASYLLYLAYRFWTAPTEVEDVITAKKAGFVKSLLAGISVTLSNPKAITFYLALMPAVLHLNEMTPTDFALIAATITVFLSLILGGYIVFASRARGFFSAPQARRLLNRIAAMVMGGAAILVVSR